MLLKGAVIHTVVCCRVLRYCTTCCFCFSESVKLLPYNFLMLKTKMARFVLFIYQRYMYALQITQHTFLVLTIHVFIFSSLPEPDELVGEIIPGSSPCEVQN